MELLTPEQIAEIYTLTDDLGLHRNAVIVPLRARDKEQEGLEMIMPDGRVLIRPPGGPRFAGWFEGLQNRLEALDLDRPLNLQ